MFPGSKPILGGTELLTGRPAAWWLGVTFVMFWAGLLAHEAAHYVAQWLLWSPSDWANPPYNSARAITAAAGPGVTLAIIILCTGLVGSSGVRLRLVAAATALGAASRVVLIAVPTMLGKWNDESLFGLCTGVSSRLCWTIEAVATAILVMIIVRKSQMSWTAVAACGVASMVGWMTAFTLGRAVGLPI